MKRISFFSIALCLISLLALGACSDDKDNNKNSEGYSNLTSEQCKQKVEQVGISLLNQINPEDHRAAIEALNSFSDLMGFSMEEDVPEILVDTYSSLAAVNNLSAAVALASGSMTFMELIAVTPGTYEYNSATQVFDRTASTPANGVIYKYPVNGSTNNAIIEATYSGESETVINGVKIPSSVKMSLIVNGTEQMKADVSHNGKLNEMNDYAEITVAGVYVTRTDISARSGQVDCKSSLRVRGKELLSMAGSAGGSFTLPENPDTGLNEDEEMEKIDNANITISILENQLSFTGVANTRAIIDYQTSHSSDIKHNRLLVDDLVKVYNDNMDIRVLDTDGLILAKVVKYTFADKRDYWNPATQKYEVRNVYYDELGFHFGDDSVIDIEEFADNGFNDLINAWVRLCDKYSAL